MSVGNIFWKNVSRLVSSFFMLTVITAVSIQAGGVLPAHTQRIVTELDTGWLYKADHDPGYSSATANESSFKRVCVPHPNAITKHAYQSQEGFWFISWYRRHFTPPAEYAGKRFYLEFEAVSIHAIVFVNGEQAGEHSGAYTPFTVDITDKVNVGEDNVIAVYVDARPQTDVPPEGSTIDFMIFGGIVRPVNLIVTDPVHVAWVFVSTDNPTKNAPSSPSVHAVTRIVNSGGAAKNCTVVTSIVDSDNSVVADASDDVEIPAGGSREVEQTTGAIANPRLWDIHNPNLYYVYTQVKEGETVIDDYWSRTGLRSLTMDKNDGKVYLNGKPIKLFGLNRHETFPYIGRAASRRLQRRDAEILKYELGCNMVRTSHYPQAPDFFDRCDEVGLLVLEEVPGWMHIGGSSWRNLQKKVLEDMIIRDRNHPCIMTFGVRINESPDDNGFYQEMNDIARDLDPTRLTCGVRRGNSDPATSFLEDIWTQNFVNPSSRAPNMPVITTEYCGHNLNPQSHSWDSDRIQISQITDGTYGHAKGHDASFRYGNWGGLLGWCAFDYASGHNNATAVEDMRYMSPHGVSDMFRLPKLAAWFYQSQRDPGHYGPMVHICNFWKSSSPTDVLVVSNCEQVELFKDGTSLGKKNSGNLYTNLPHPLFSWNTSFSSGELKAVGYIGGTEASTHTVHTPGQPAEVTIVPDTSTLFTGGDMTQVVVSLVDSYGQVLRDRGDAVTLSAEGAGDFMGEERVDLEGGQMAFYVKTRGSETGTITCNASVGSFSANATITVIKKEAVPVRTVPVSGTLRVPLKQPCRYIFCSPHLALPSSFTPGQRVRVFSLNGRLVHSTVIKEGECSLNLTKSAHGVRIIKIYGKPVSAGHASEQE